MIGANNITLVTTEKTEASSTSKKEDIDLLAVLKTLQEKGESTGLVSECIKLCNQKMIVNKKKEQKKLQKEKDRNDRIFRRILRDKNTMNDFEFFEKMEPSGQKKIIKELREINKVTRIEKPYRLTLLEADIPVNFKGAAMKKIGTLRHMEPGSGEYYKIKNWVDTFMRIPFGKTKDLPIRPRLLVNSKKYVGRLCTLSFQPPVRFLHLHWFSKAHLQTLQFCFHTTIKSQ